MGAKRENEGGSLVDRASNQMNREYSSSYGCEPMDWKATGLEFSNEESGTDLYHTKVFISSPIYNLNERYLRGCIKRSEGASHWSLKEARKLHPIRFSFI
jgi:hypothetical protein